MGPQKQKTSKPRRPVEDSENQMRILEPPKGNADKIRFQKNKIALEDLTNKSITTPIKSMGNATDKEDDPGSDEKQSVNKSYGRQLRSKAKPILSLNPIDNCERQTVSKHNNSSKTLTKVKHPLDNVGDEDARSVGRDLSNDVKCSRQTRQTVKGSTSLSLHCTSARKFTSPKGSPIGRSIQLCPGNLPNVKEQDALEKSKDSSIKGKMPTDVPGLSSKQTIEPVQHLRRTRNTIKSQNISTLNNPDKPKEVSPESSVKGAKDDSQEALLCQTDSRVEKSPILRNKKSSLSRKKKETTTTAKVPKAKKKTALEKWIEQAGEVSLPDVSSSSSSGTCRKSARLSLSKLSSKKLASPKSDSKVNSPRSASKRTLVTKKVPVWKTEPKPERLHSAADDVYGFEYDASECKPAKKKRTRKPKKEDVFKASKVVVAPKLTKRLPRTAIGAAYREDVQESVMKTEIKTKPLKTGKAAANDTTPLLKAVAEKLKKMADHLTDDESEKGDGLNDISHIYPIAHESVNVYDVTLPENVDGEREPFSEEKDKSNESGVLAGDLEETGQVIPSYISQAEADVENLFGFEDPENYPSASSVDQTVEKQLVKSTPIKQSTVAECFASVSPVRKVAKASRKSVNRPARIDEDVARDLIRGIRPLQPAMDKQKSTTLMQYIKDVTEEDPDEEDRDSMIKVPPTPPTVFTQPSRRSYSKRELRTVKRTIFQDDDDKESEASDEEEAAPKKSKKRVGGKTVQKKNKRDEEEEQWCKLMNSHFEDVEKFNLSF